MLSKTRDPELEHMCTASIQRAKDEPDCIHLQAVADFKEDVVGNHPTASDAGKDTQRVKQTATEKHQSHKHQNHCGGKHKNHHPDAKTILLRNGKKIKCHHLSRFDASDFKLFTHQQKRTLFNKCQAANQKSEKEDEEKMESQIPKSLMFHIEDNNGAVSEITQQNDTPPGLPSSIMEGCDSQDKRNRGG